MIPTTYPTREEIARLSASMLLEVGAVHFNAREPFTHASGKKAPTYVDCRKLISFPRIRTTLMDFLACTIMRDAARIGAKSGSSINSHNPLAIRAYPCMSRQVS